tara:strand:+ start:14702 stop:15007 length:306 start_codon:yes stop_codon:yes gene_type:complete
MRLLTINEYSIENPTEFDGNNIYQDITNERLKSYTEYLAENVGNIMDYSDYITDKINEHVDYVEFIKRPDDISFEEWMKIKDDENALKLHKREQSINEIIK